MDKKLMDKVAQERLKYGNAPELKGAEVWDKRDWELWDNSKKPQGKALKNAEMSAPTKSEAVKPKQKPAKSISFAAMERDLPQGGEKAMKIAKELDPDKSMMDMIERMKPGGKMKKAAGRFGKAALALTPVGLGVSALMEGLDAEEGGSEEEKLDEVSMGQAMKTEAKIKADKAAMKPKSLPASTKKSYPTKKKEVVKASPQAVKKTVVETREIPVPKGKSDEQKVMEFNQEAKRNIPDWKIEGMDETVDKVMRDEFKKAAKESNKKPLSDYIKK